MKKIVFFSTPAFGHLNCVYPVIEKLVKNNYHVDWYCSKKYKEFVEKTGANFIEYKVDFDKYSLSDLTANFYNLYKGLLNINKECYLKYLGDLNSNRPDLIIYDSMCSFAKNISKKLKIKSVCFCTTMAYNYFTFIFSNMFFSTMKLMCKNIKSIIKLYKEEKKFRKDNDIIKLNAMDLFVNKGDITLVFTPKELQPFYKMFSNDFIFVGTTIKDRITNKTKYKKYDIYISLGSIFNEKEDVLNKIVNCDLLKNKKTIISVGKLQIKSSNNIEFVKSTDQISLLPNIDLFINHGGLNSVYESLYFGKFQICIPQQEEQKMTSIIINKKKIGIYTKNFDNINIDKIESCKNSYIKNIEKYKNIIISYDGTQIAFDNIEKLI